MIAQMRQQPTDEHLIEYVVTVDNTPAADDIECHISQALDRAHKRGDGIYPLIEIEEETNNSFRIWRFVGQVGFIDDFGLKLFVQLTAHFDGPITVDRNPCGYRWHG